MERTSPTTRPMPLIATAIVVLTLSTAYIHLSLGGPLFTLNAVGYAALAVGVDRDRHARRILSFGGSTGCRASASLDMSR